MAVVSILEDLRKVPASADINGEKKAVREFCVITDSVDDREAEVLAAVGIELGDTHPRLESVRCENISLDRTDTFLWMVTCDYSSSTPGSPPSEDPQEQGDPEKENSTGSITWDTVMIEEAFTTGYLYTVGGTAPDTTNDTPVAVCNSAKDPFDPPPTIEIPVPQCTIVRNELTTPPTILNLVGSMNRDTYTLDGIEIGPGESKMVSISVGRKIFYRTQEYKEVTYVIQIRPLIDTLVSNSAIYSPVSVQHPAWDITIADMGLNQLVTGRVKERMVQDDGTDSATPLFLDGYGKKLDPAGDADIEESDIVFRVYRWPYEANFSVLNLPA